MKKTIDTKTCQYTPLAPLNGQTVGESQCCQCGTYRLLKWVTIIGIGILLLFAFYTFKMEQKVRQKNEKNPLYLLFKYKSEVGGKYWLGKNFRMWCLKIAKIRSLFATDIWKKARKERKILHYNKLWIVRTQNKKKNWKIQQLNCIKYQ